MILVLDFGGQYNQLIARKVREQRIYAEIVPYSKITVAEILERGYKGVILTGGPNSVCDDAAPHFDPALLDAGIPVLGICYGAQLIAYMAGGTVSAAGGSSEYGRTRMIVTNAGLVSDIFRGIPRESSCWMSHTDYISRIPEGFRITAETDSCPCAAMECRRKRIYAVQFHPEVAHTDFGEKILAGFLTAVCDCSGDWVVEDFAERAVGEYRRRLAGKKVLLALSGGVDSSVAALLLHKAVGRDLVCIFVDHGMLRKGEADFVEKTFRDKWGMNFIRVSAGPRFLAKLAGVTEPERKRKIIGEEFIRVFEEEAGKIGEVNVLAQGTIYPDVIESGKGDSAVIKSHHNVGGLPEVISFEEIVEPLRDLFKDEVRKVGTALGLPPQMVWRQPFPGPGLAVRIIGEITEEKLALVREADAIFREEVARARLTRLPDQYFAVLTDTRTVGVMGDGRTYGCTVALRAVTTDDFMTADWTRLPFKVLARSSSRITNEVPGISRVVFDVTSKPPATVEWE